MTPEEYEAARRIFLEACNLEPRERGLFLEKACAGRAELREFVERLLERDERPSSETWDAVFGSLFGQESDASPEEGTIDVPAPSADPESIGPYRVLETLGEGGMGIVYLAEQTGAVRRRVAVKLIKLGMDTREVIARFESERQALALMDHPNIAKVHDAGTAADGRPYFVMEYVPGISITEHCDRHRLSTRERLDLFLEICDAVQHAHHKAVIHRDIKPSNILVTVQGDKASPKIIDFGIAKAISQRLTEKTLFTRHGQVVGTPAYMSPEQADPTAQDIDTRTDVYSLGVLLYELLVGTLPFESEALREAGFAEIQRIIREDDPPKPSSRIGTQSKAADAVATSRRTSARHLARELRGDLDWITLKALEKERTRRYATARDLAEDIRRHLRNDPVLAGPPSALYRLGKLVKKHPGRIVAAGAVILFAAVLVGQSLYFHEKERIAGIRRSREFLGVAEKAWQSFRRIRGDLASLGAALAKAEDSLEPWQPVWERTPEIESRRELQEAKDRLDGLYNQAVSSLLGAWQVAPAGSPEKLDAREHLAEVFFARYEEAVDAGQVAFSPGFFETMVRAQAIEDFDERLIGRGRIAMRSDPPGAEVFCFRCESFEERLVPLPFDPGGPGRPPGVSGRPFLLVEKVWAPDHETFQAGDRVLEVEGRELSLHGDLAAALRGVEADRSVRVTVLREGQPVALSWIPFPGAEEDFGEPLVPGRVVDFREQLGFTLAGYPLDFTDSCRIGATESGAGLEVELPRGSYLLVLRKEGFAEARVPVSVRGQEPSMRVRLFGEDEVPAGYVHIPAGEVSCGGDDGAYEGLPAGSQHVGDVFLARLEVTAGEWLEFIRDPEVSPRIGADGTAEVRVDWDADVLRDLRPRESREGEPVRVQLVPLLVSKLLFQQDDATKAWSLREGHDPDVPIHGISMLAGIEYAEWLTSKAGDHPRWRFRLPGDIEWEKAARGADRRIHVWGEHLVLSFCKSLQGSPGRRGRTFQYDPAGGFPLDESVYGIRDMAGSMGEPILAVASPRLRMYVVRGGTWAASDRRDFRAATRNRRLPERGYTDVGLRLAAEPIAGR